MEKVKLLTATEVADRLRITESQLAWQVQAKRAPRHAIIAGRRMWRESDVESFITEAFEAAS